MSGARNLTRPTAPGTSTEPYEDWRHDAECRTEDPELFFPSPTDVVGVARAVSICSGCEVRGACATWALDTRQRDGIWGGLTEGERALILRRRRRAGR